MTWWEKAACRGMDVELFHAAKPPRVVRQVCAGCEVTARCLEFILDNEEPSFRQGFWGGMSAFQRKQVFGGAPARVDERYSCKYGHEFTPENVYMDDDGYRLCVQCRKDRAREYRERQKAS